MSYPTIKDIGRYIGIPFVPNKSAPVSFHGVDCWGLIRLFYREEFGIEVPDPLISPGDVGRVFEEYQKEISSTWEAIDSPEPWCIIAMAQDPLRPDIVQHFGLSLPGGRVLHTSASINSHTSYLSTLRWSVKGYYRWAPR